MLFFRLHSVARTLSAVGCEKKAKIVFCFQWKKYSNLTGSIFFPYRLSRWGINMIEYNHCLHNPHYAVKRKCTCRIYWCQAVLRRNWGNIVLSNCSNCIYFRVFTKLIKQVRTEYSYARAELTPINSAVSSISAFQRIYMNEIILNMQVIS